MVTKKRVHLGPNKGSPHTVRLSSDYRILFLKYGNQQTGVHVGPKNKGQYFGPFKGKEPDALFRDGGGIEGGILEFHDAAI